MKKLSLIIALLMALTFVFGACDTSHEHTYSEKWDNNETHHWRNPTCDDTDDVTDYGEHSFVNHVCTVCKYQEIVLPSHTHTYSDSYTFDDTNHWRNPTCDDADDVKDFGKHTFNSSYKCSVCGATQKATDIIADKVRGLDFAYTLCASDIVVSAQSGQTYSFEYMELYLSVSDGNALQGQGYVVYDVATPISDEDGVSGQTAKLVIKDDIAYVILGEGSQASYMRIPAEQLLEQAGITVEQIQEALETLDKQSETFVEYLLQVEQIAQLLKSFDLDVSDKILIKDTEASVDGKEVYSVNFEALRELNDILAVTTIQQYADVVFGDGFYDDIDYELTAIMQNSIGSVLEMLEEKGITVKDIVMISNLFVSLFVDGYNSVDELLAKYGLFGYAPTFEGLLNNPFFRMSTLSFVLNTIFESAASENGTEPMTVDAIITAIKAFSVQYRDVTLYGLLLADNEILTVSELNEVIDYALTTLCERAQVTLVYSDGILESVTAEVTALHTVDETEPTEEYVASIKAMIDAVINSFSGKITLIRNYETEIDYSDVIEKVTSNGDAAAA